MFNAKINIMYYTSKMIQVAKLETIFGELIEWAYCRTDNVVIKVVDGQNRTSYPVENVKEAYSLVSKLFQTA